MPPRPFAEDRWVCAFGRKTSGLPLLSCQLSAAITTCDGRCPTICPLASPAGFEPATCGLEIRCYYPAELRGRDPQLLSQDRVAPPAAALVGLAAAMFLADRQRRRCGDAT